MPVMFRDRGFRFLFYSSECDRREPPHVHVVKDGIDAKFWLLPDVDLAYNDGHSEREIARLLLRACMTISVTAKSVRFDEEKVSLDLSDGRVLTVPLAWYPRLLAASAEERAKVEISTRGLHRESIDEDLSIEGLIAGREGANRAARRGRAA